MLRHAPAGCHYKSPFAKRSKTDLKACLASCCLSKIFELGCAINTQKPSKVTSFSCGCRSCTSLLCFPKQTNSADACKKTLLCCCWRNQWCSKGHTAWPAYQPIKHGLVFSEPPSALWLITFGALRLRRRCSCFCSSGDCVSLLLCYIFKACDVVR